MIAKLLRAWDRYWFSPSPPETLALVRIICFTLAFLIYFNVDIRPWTAVSPAFWMPVSLFRFLPGPPRNVVALGVLQILWKLSLLTAALGLLTRVSLVTATLLGYFVFGLPNCFGKIHHLDGFVLLVFLILAASRCDDVLTLERFLWKNRPPPPAPSGVYTWPVRIAQTIFLLVFFAAGLSKVRHSGLAWIDPQNMRALLLGNLLKHQPPTRWAQWIVPSDALCSTAAAATILIELSALPAIFIRSVRIPVVIALMALQTAISLLMGIYFVPYLVGYALFVPWRKLYPNSHV